MGAVDLAGNSTVLFVVLVVMALVVVAVPAAVICLVWCLIRRPKSFGVVAARAALSVPASVALLILVVGADTTWEKEKRSFNGVRRSKKFTDRVIMRS